MGKIVKLRGHYAVEAGTHTTRDGVNVFHSMGGAIVLLSGESRGTIGEYSTADVLSTEEASVNGPGAWPNHGQGTSKDCKHDRHPKIAAGNHDPELDDSDECPRDRGP